MLSSLAKTWFDSPRFKRDVSSAGAGEVVRWWESRRFFFNCAVGCAGIITCCLCLACAFISEPIVGEAIGLPDGPLLGVFGVLFYGLLANVFYTGGWICELFMRSVMVAEKSAAFGVRAFRIGLQFSIFLTLCPAVFSWLAFGVAFLHGQKHAPIVE